MKLKPELLLGVFIMMFAVFVYQFIMDRFDLTRRRQKIVMAGLFGMAEIMTMTFPFNVTTGVFVDLRDVPVVLSTLYGGPGVGGFVVIAFAVNRLLRGGGGMLSAFISVPALFLTAVLIRSWYKRSPRLTKIVAVMAIVDESLRRPLLPPYVGDDPPVIFHALPHIGHDRVQHGNAAGERTDSKSGASVGETPCGW